MHSNFKFFGLLFLNIAASSSAANFARAQQSSIPDLAKFSAAPTSAVKKFSHSTVRLLKGNFKDGVWQIGVEIKMGPKWKTYWRVPGDAGVPPEFIWKNSTNLSSANVSYPAPSRYEDITGKSIGYKKRVIFPVTVKSANKEKPIKLDLRFYYAICSDICVPAQANIGLDLPPSGSSSSAQADIDAFKTIVPRADEIRISVRKTEVLRVNGKPSLAVSLSGQLANETDILVEGFEDAYFGAPSSSGKGNEATVFLLPIEGLEKGATMSGKKIKLTILSGDIRLVSNVVVK